MRYAIFSDVHGNLEAFEAVCEAFRQEAIDVCLCAGDIVGYGAEPVECMQRISSLKVISIAGNHDWAVAGKFSAYEFNPLAKEALLWTKQKLSEEQKLFLEELPLVYKNKDFTMVHGTLQEPECFHYLSDLSLAPDMFREMEPGVCFIGHTHNPKIICQNGDQIFYVEGESLRLQGGSKVIVNVGSVGQPRDGCSSASYCLFDSSEKEIVIKRVSYSVEKTQEKILAAGLLPMLGTRLGLGV